MRQVHEDFVVKLSNVIDGFVERDMQRFSAPHSVIERYPDQERSLADAVSGDDDSNVSAAKAAINRVFEESQWIAFVEFFSVHSGFLVY
jgi:hypothetical protein